MSNYVNLTCMSGNMHLIWTFTNILKSLNAVKNVFILVKSKLSWILSCLTVFVIKVWSFHLRTVRNQTEELCSLSCSLCNKWLLERLEAWMWFISHPCLLVHGFPSQFLITLCLLLSSVILVDSPTGKHHLQTLQEPHIKLLSLVCTLQPTNKTTSLCSAIVLYPGILRPPLKVCKQQRYSTTKLLPLWY